MKLAMIQVIILWKGYNIHWMKVSHFQNEPITTVSELVLDSDYCFSGVIMTGVMVPDHEVDHRNVNIQKLTFLGK